MYTVQGTNKNVYTVRKADTLPHVNRTCPLLCRDCQVCVHGFSCSCVDSALRNTICKHIHLVVQTYNPVCSYVTGPVAPVDECVGDDDIAADDVVEVEEDEIPELACETVSTGHQALPDVSESEAILNQRSQQRNSNVETTQLVATVESAISYVRAAMNSDHETLVVVAEHMTRLRSLVAAMSNREKPGCDRLPAPVCSNEPANRKAPTQRAFRSTRRSRKRKPQVTASKPTHEEKQFLLKALEGNTEVVSYQPVMDHDYSSDISCHVINFEHSYT